MKSLRRYTSVVSKRHKLIYWPAFYTERQSESSASKLTNRVFQLEITVIILTMNNVSSRIPPILAHIVEFLTISLVLPIPHSENFQSKIDIKSPIPQPSMFTKAKNVVYKTAQTVNS